MGQGNSRDRLKKGKRGGGGEARSAPSSPAVQKKKDDIPFVEDAPPSSPLRKGDGKRQPVVFRWRFGGKKVYIVGTFTNWKEKLPLSPSGNDFVGILHLDEGAYQYRYIVDEHWRFDPDQPTAVDESGEVSNFIEVQQSKQFSQATVPAVDETGEEYGQIRKRFEINRKNPAILPPHLRYTPLNQQMHIDPSLLPLPQHVVLNHTFTRIEGDVFALGLTHRFKNKFSTIVLYKPLKSIESSHSRSSVKESMSVDQQMDVDSPV
eukprot:TRINITY_DN2221_c0_g1_i1.p1 TRINITY_DN2221_c0_g1~~TRINITY_DN2221_c0_g1_i1.p1  ORF type:complete len:263 (-),score=68.01 TRINITY_DN2221_c0_g1_i1:195-983(-)